jgi:hypothetical protein
VTTVSAALFDLHFPPTAILKSMGQPDSHGPKRRNRHVLQHIDLANRNLNDVFGENDPARRRAAIDEIFAKERRKLVA